MVPRGGTFYIRISTHTHTCTVVLISLKLVAQNVCPSETGKTGCVCACVCEALPNWAVLVREDCGTAECMCVFRPYKHAAVWFCICKAGVNCSLGCV